jgi:hypothetical protein
MPEYTYDPLTGTASETRGGRSIYTSITAATEEQSLGSREEIERAQQERTASALARRASVNQRTAGTTDQDLDEGTFNVASANLELQLQQVQQRLYHSTNPAEQAKLAHEAEELAAQLVGARAVEDPARYEDEQSIQQAIREEMGPRAAEVLANAADNLSEESTSQLNEILSSDDELTVRTSMQVLEGLKDHPEAFSTDRSSWNTISQDQFSQLVDLVGAENANDIQTISAAIASGVATPAEVLKTVSRDPVLLKALITGAQAGVYQLML